MSRCISRFAVPFVDPRAKASTTEIKLISVFVSRLIFVRIRFPTICMDVLDIAYASTRVSAFSKVDRSSPSDDLDQSPETMTRCSELFPTARMILPQVHLRKPCYDFSFL